MIKKKKILILGICPIILLVIFTTNKVEATKSANLIINPSVEKATPRSNRIQNWSRNHSGNSDAQFNYSESAQDGNHSLEVNMDKYSTGDDAKWYFNPVKVLPETEYQFIDYYQSSVETEIVVEVTFRRGEKQYISLGDVPPSLDWRKISFTFITPVNAKKVTVLHVLKSVGYLRTDNFSLSPYSPEFKEGMVSVAFDDGTGSAYDNGLPILNKHSLPATLYMVPNFTGSENYMTKDELLELKNSGFEIGSYYQGHPNLISLPSGRIEDEFSQSKEGLEGQSLGPVTGLAVPYGGYNDEVVDTAKKHYKYLRSSDAGFNTKRDFNAYNIKVQSVTRDTSRETVEGWIEQARKEKTWLVLLYHQVDESKQEYSTKPEDFEYEMSHVKHSGLKVKTIGKALLTILPQLLQR